MGARVAHVARTLLADHGAALRQMLDDPFATEVIVDFLGANHRGVVSEAERRLRPVRAAHPHDPGPAWVHAATLFAQGRPHDAREACVPRHR